MSEIKQYFSNLGFNFSRLLNSIIAGERDDTLSERMGRKVRENKCFFCKVICRFLHLIDPNHCEDAIEDDASNR